MRRARSKDERFIVLACDPSGAIGAKAAAEITTDGVAPAVVNAIYDAVGVRHHEIPATPGRAGSVLTFPTDFQNRKETISDVRLSLL